MIIPYEDIRTLEEETRVALLEHLVTAGSDGYSGDLQADVERLDNALKAKTCYIVQDIIAGEQALSLITRDTANVHNLI